MIRLLWIAALGVVGLVGVACTSDEALEATVAPETSTVAASPPSTATLTATATARAAVTATPTEEATPESDETATSTPTPATARTPLTQTEQAQREELEQEMRAVPGVAEVLEAIEGDDAAALTALFLPQVGYCPRVSDDYEPAAHLARCTEGDTTYLAWAVGTNPWRGSAFSAVATWNQNSTAELLDDALTAGIELRTASLHRYRRALPDGGLVVGERYLLTFALGPNELHHHPAWRATSEPATLRFQVESGETFPIDGVDFLPRDAPRPSAVKVTSEPGAARLDASDTRVVEALEQTPIAHEVVEAFTSGDLDAALALFHWQETNCISPPLPGKEIPEVCDGLDLPPGSTYRSVYADFGTLFPASEQRIRWWLSGLFARDRPVVAAAWQIDGPWFDGGSNQRIAIAFVSEPVSLIRRDGQMSYWGDALDGIWVFVDPVAKTPITFIRFIGSGGGSSHLLAGFEEASGFTATRLGVD